MEHYSKADALYFFFLRMKEEQIPEGSNLVDPASYICLS